MNNVLTVSYNSVKLPLKLVLRDVLTLKLLVLSYINLV